MPHADTIAAYTASHPPPSFPAAPSQYLDTRGRSAPPSASTIRASRTPGSRISTSSAIVSPANAAIWQQVTEWTNLRLHGRGKYGPAPIAAFEHLAADHLPAIQDALNTGIWAPGPIVLGAPVIDHLYSNKRDHTKN